MENELKPYDYQQETHSNYEVWLRDKRTGNRRSIILWAESFAQAERLVTSGRYTRVHQGVLKDEEIVKIDKEYEIDTQEARTDGTAYPPYGKYPTEEVNG